MNEKNQVKVDITGDIEGYKKANDAALAEQKRFNEAMTASDRYSQSAMARAEEQFHRERVAREKAAAEEIQRARSKVFESDVESNFYRGLKREAETLGMSKRQLMGYNASQELVTKEARALAQANIDKISAFEREQSMMQSLTGFALRAVAAYVSLAAARQALTKTVLGAADAERSEAQFQAIYRSTGGTSGFSRAQLGDIVDDMTRRTRFGDEEIRDAMTRLMTFRQVSGQAFKEAMLGAAGLADVMGGSLVNAAEALGAALQNPEAAMMRLTHAGVSLTNVQKEAVKELVEHGRQAEAMTIILQAMRDSGFMKVSEEINKPGGYIHAISGATKAWNELFETLGQSSGVKPVVVGVLEAIAGRLNNIKDSIETGTWFPKLIALMSQGLLEPVPPGAPSLQARSAEEAERAAARWAAQEQRWQTAFEAQYGGASSGQEKVKPLADFIRDFDEKERRRAEAQQGIGERWHSADESDAQSAAGREIARIKDRLKVYDDESAAALRRLAHQEQLARAGDEHAMALKKEADAIRAANDPYEKYNQQIEKLDRLKRNDMLTMAEYAAAQDKAVKELGEDLGWLEKKGTDAFKELKDAVEGWGRDTSRAFAKIAFDGRFSFQTLGDAARRFGEELLAIQIQRSMMEPGLRAGTMFLEDLFRPGALPDASTRTGAFGGMDAGAISAMQFNAMGNAFHRGRVIPFRDGGVVRRPTLFPMANGMGLMAEEHEEAIMPLKRTASGKLGVEATGGRAPRVTVNVINQSGVPVQAEAAAPRIEGDAMVVDLVLTRLARDGAARDQLRGMLAGPPNY